MVRSFVPSIPATDLIILPMLTILMTSSAAMPPYDRALASTRWPGPCNQACDTAAKRNLTRTLWSVCHPAMEAALYLMAHAGLRLSEALALRWSDLSVDPVPHLSTVGKGQKPRKVGLTPEATADTCSST